MAGVNHNFMFTPAEFDCKSNGDLDGMFGLLVANPGPTDAGLINSTNVVNGMSSGDGDFQEFQQWVHTAVAPFGIGHFDDHKFALGLGEYQKVTRDRTDYAERMQTGYYNRSTGKNPILSFMHHGFNGFAALQNWATKSSADLHQPPVLGKRSSSGSESVEGGTEPSAKRMRNNEGGYTTGPGTDLDFEDDMVYLNSNGATDHNTNSNYQGRHGQRGLKRYKKSAIRTLKRSWKN